MDDPESRLRHFHFTRTSNHTCTSLFKVTVLCFSPLSSICLVFSPLTLLTVNWSFIRSFIEHISHTSFLISYHQGFKLTLCLPYRLSHVTAAVHQPRCISCFHLCRSTMPVWSIFHSSITSSRRSSVLLSVSRSPFYSPVALVNMINSMLVSSSPPLFQMITPVSGCRPWRGNRAPITLMQITLM